MSLDSRPRTVRTSSRAARSRLVVAFVLGVAACGEGAPVSTPVDGPSSNAAAAGVSGGGEVFMPVATTSTLVPATLATTPSAANPTEPVSTPDTPVDTTTESSPSTRVGTTDSPTPETTAADDAPGDDATAAAWRIVDDHLATTILEWGSRAVSATVLRDGEIVHEMAAGTRTTGGEPVEIGDRFRIASISKIVTAIVTLQLVEDGLLGLDEPVGARLADRVGVDAPAAGVEAITPRHLLSHRSGIAQYENLMFARQVESCPEAGAVALTRNLQRAPGTTMNYSNVNFCLLGELIEAVAGDAYEQVVTERLLEPLDIEGMRLAGTFDVGDGDVQHESEPERNYMEVLDGAGSWIASPTDVAAILDSVDADTPGWSPLSAAMLAEMKVINVDPPLPPDPTSTPPTASTAPPPPPTRGYGLGLMIFGPGSFGHTGTLESTRTMTVRQADGLTWVIAVSGDAPWETRELQRIMAEALALGFG